MDALSDAARWAAELRNGAWLVRSYARPHQRALRAQAIAQLGASVREAFTRCADHEQLLIALAEGLRPNDYKAPF